MSEALRLALRDLRGGLRGLGLLWLCLAISVAAIASVLSLASSIDRAISSHGHELLGGDLALTVAQRTAKADELAALQALGPVSKTVTLRATIVAPGGRTQLAELSGVDSSWPLAGQLNLTTGKPPSGQTVALGADLAERLAIRAGDRVRIGYGEFRVSGIIDSDLPQLAPEDSLGALTRYFAAYNLVCGPVVDEENHLLGAVSVDDVLDHLLPDNWRERESEPLIVSVEGRHE